MSTIALNDAEDPATVKRGLSLYKLAAIVHPIHLLQAPCSKTS